MTTDHLVEPRLRALPVQLIPMRKAVILRRGATEVRIDGERSQEAVETILAAVSGRGATVAEVCERFAEPDRPAVTRLLGQLRTRRLLVPAGSPTPAGNGTGTDTDNAVTNDTITGGTSVEDTHAGDTSVEDSRLDIFYWHFGQRGADVARSLSARQIAVVGVNAVSQRLVRALTAIGATNVAVLDYPPLRGTEHLTTDHDSGGAGAAVGHADWLDRADADELHCVIATSDFDASECLRLWNRFCVERRIPFLPVVQRDLLGTVGPLVLPGETPCYECVRARESSHLDDPAARHAVAEAASEGQRFAALHPAGTAVLAELAAVELSKWFGGGRPPTRQVGTLVEVNVAEPAVAVRKVLRVPRCPVCSPSNTHSAGAVRASDLNPS
ncbi:MAG: TOMM precursor leader peptide-binding protein [Pseudonocardiaceae bacterium]